MTLKYCRLCETLIVGNFRNLQYICILQGLYEKQYVILEQTDRK